LFGLAVAIRLGDGGRWAVKRERALWGCCEAAGWCGAVGGCDEGVGAMLVMVKERA
jgi:hypothetical protein